MLHHTELWLSWTAVEHSTHFYRFSESALGEAERVADGEPLMGEAIDDEVPIILMTVPPVHEDTWDKHCAEVFGESGKNRANSVSRSYGKVVCEVGEELGCCVLDVYGMMMEGDGSEYARHLSDGLHLSSSGNEVIFEGLMTLIRDEYPHLAPMEGDGKNEASGIPMEEKLWTDLC